MGDKRSVRAAQKRAQRRQEVLETALRVFTQHGYHQTRISDIIEAAGIARGTFYLYFDSKNAIFHELVDLLIGRIRQNVVGVDVSPDAPPVRDQILVSVRRILRVFHDNPALTRMVLREAVGVDDEVDRKLHDFWGHLHAWLAESLVDGKAIGFIRELEEGYVAWCIIGSVRQCLQLGLDGRGASVDVDHLAEVILDFNLQGIVASPSACGPSPS